MVAGNAEFARAEIEELSSSLNRLAELEYTALLTEIADKAVESLRSGGRILFCGNGGSAADAQHLAAELVGGRDHDRVPLAGIALTVDTSVLTAVSNDYGYEKVFARQVEAIGRPGDVLFGLSTSGRSVNVVVAQEAARKGGLVTVAFTGKDPADLAGADVVLAVPSVITAKVQELHIVCGHIVLARVARMLRSR